MKSRSILGIDNSPFLLISPAAILRSEDKLDLLVYRSGVKLDNRVIIRIRNRLCLAKHIRLIRGFEFETVPAVLISISETI